MKLFQGLCKNCLYGIKKINSSIRCKVDDKLRNPLSKCKILLPSGKKGGL